jgi:hypothetical protein
MWLNSRKTLGRDYFRPNLNRLDFVVVAILLVDNWELESLGMSVQRAV